MEDLGPDSKDKGREEETQFIDVRYLGARCSEGWVHKVQARSRDFGVTTAILLPRWPFSVSGKFAAFLERRVSQENPARRFVLCGGAWFWPAARV